MENELIGLLPKVVEYGAVGIFSLTLYLIAKMFLPHFVTLTKALSELPPVLSALAERVKEVEAGLSDVRKELAVVKDRLPRASTATLRGLLERSPDA